MQGFNSLKCSVTPDISFERLLSLSITYVLWKIEENLCWGSLIFFFNFSAHASSKSAIILAAWCWQKLEFNWKDDTRSNYLLDIPTLIETLIQEIIFEGRFVKIGVVFHALYFENEVGDPPGFFAFLT